MNLRPPGYEPGELTGLLHAASLENILAGPAWKEKASFTVLSETARKALKTLCDPFPSRVNFNCIPKPPQ